MLGIVNTEYAVLRRNEETGDGWLAGVAFMSASTVRACFSVM